MTYIEQCAEIIESINHILAVFHSTDYVTLGFNADIGLHTIDVDGTETGSGLPIEPGNNCIQAIAFILGYHFKYSGDVIK